MTVGTLCVRKVITVDPDTDVANAAAVMRENHVGYLVVTEPYLGLLTPIGVLTDRDIVIKVIAKG
ncbi:MAG TPA: CBS domain-containing protein, partial [Steroidobacteraceae bacterium]|nr:CBS domain-containing protein [Steroidobacteraceae bacterium]